MQKVKKGDEVIVIAGKNKGLRGKVLRVVDCGAKVLVEGVNLVKRHIKANPNANIEGGIVEKEAALAVSNVQVFNPKISKGDRVLIKVLEDGKKVRYFKTTGEPVEII